MTVVVGFLCSDGAVIAADSMLTPSMGNIPTGHHEAKKVGVLPGDQLLAWAGDQGQAHRFKLFATARAAFVAQAHHPYEVVHNLAVTVLNDFDATKILGSVNTNTLLAFRHGGTTHLCVFQGPLQPLLLDTDHFHAALGSGKLMADPFLAFLLDTFSPTQPTMREAVFLATWVLDHVIRTNPGGVAGPVRIALLPSDPAVGGARELADDEIQEQRQAIEGAVRQLRAWRDTLSGISPEPPDTTPPPTADLNGV